MPSVLTDTEILEFRGLVEELAMPDSCTIGGGTLTANDSGGYTAGTGSTIAVSPCRLRSAGLQPQERAIADRLEWSVAYAIDLPYTVTVSPTHAIILSGRTFEVGGVVDDGAWAMKKVAIVKEAG